MNLKGILSIATYPGLYRHVAQAKNGLIVESIVDGKRTMAYATSRISALEDISIYTTDGDTKLSDVYRNIYNVLEGKKTPFAPKKAKDEELTDLFSKALPNWDTDRVYISDIKRAFAWYNILVEKGLVDGKEEEAENKEGEEAAAATEEPAQETGVKTRKRTRKKAADAAAEDAPKAE
ncbi:MAG: DUF5606 domain-containing protein [Bacteroidales bacterium]|nr:DUF5606 domain-containing protein [Bacteroidales bacterium]